MAAAVVYPWNEPNAAPHVKARQPVMEILAPAGIRHDLPRRRDPDELPLALQGVEFGIVVMSHRGFSNGRLSVLLSTIPANYPVTVSSDDVELDDLERDMEIATHHGAAFAHCSPWGGRAKNARHCMDATPWRVTFFVCDDIWLFPETVRDSLGWFYRLEQAGVPLACLGVPGWETYVDHPRWGFESWGHCLREPWRFEAVPPHPRFMRCPALYTNPFGACMVINRDAYTDVGGFAENYWAHDDVFNHRVWLSNRWVCAVYPGRGYMHLGAQSWHHGETEQYVGKFPDATGMTGDESGKLQNESKMRWASKLGDIFLRLGGTPAV